MPTEPTKMKIFPRKKHTGARKRKRLVYSPKLPKRSILSRTRSSVINGIRNGIKNGTIKHK